MMVGAGDRNYERSQANVNTQPVYAHIESVYSHVESVYSHVLAVYAHVSQCTLLYTHIQHSICKCSDYADVD